VARKSNGGRHKGQARCKVCGAIHRVHHPHPLAGRKPRFDGRGGFGSAWGHVFFAQEVVRGKHRRNLLPDDLLTSAINFSHNVFVVQLFTFYSGPHARKYFNPCSPGSLFCNTRGVGQGWVVGQAHGA
jgi:hypothetical protein